MKRMKSNWHVYIVQCKDGTLYTGVAVDVRRRIVEHNSSPKGAKYTRARRPVKLVYREKVKDRSVAGKREAVIKKLTRLQKQALIRSHRRK